MPDRVAITRMVVAYKWETGHYAKVYSPKGRYCKGSVRKRIGGFLVSLGSYVLFGRNGWKTYIDSTEDEVSEVTGDV